MGSQPSKKLTTEQRELIAEAVKSALRRAVKLGVEEERERIRNAVLSLCQHLKTMRPDAYGAGWNAALYEVRVRVEKK